MRSKILRTTIFTLHRWLGLLAGSILAIIAFTGFCWNFHAQSEPIIYALTNSPPPLEPVSKPIAGKDGLPLSTLLQAANTALPGTRTTFVSIPSQPTAAYMSIQVFPSESVETARQTRIYLDRYTGAVLYLKNAQKPSLGDRVSNWFHPLHYGTFWGLPSRILYIFVGLAPAVLLITSLVMWKYRQKLKTRSA